MSTLKTEIREITPTWAQEQLSKLEESLNKGTFRQRAARKATIHRYAQDMKNGKWVLTHQGIAFNERDQLIDGQNRLWAIVRSGCTVPMMVTTGIPHNGKLTAMDVIDNGASRTLAQAFQVSHGYGHEALELAMLAKQIVRMVLGTSDLGRKKVHQVSVALALFIIEELNYRNSFERIQNLIPLRKLRLGPIIAPLAWYHMLKPKKAERFASDFALLEGLAKGSPALVLYRYVTNSSGERRKPTSTLEKQSITALAIQRYDEGGELDRAMVSVGKALRWLVMENKEHADKIMNKLVS